MWIPHRAKGPQWILPFIGTLLLCACDRQEPDEASAKVPETGTGVGLQRTIPDTTQPVQDAEMVPLESLDSRASYGIGYRMGVSVSKDENLNVDHEAILAGLRDGLTQRRQRLSEEEMQRDGKALGERATAKVEEIEQVKLEESRRFLESNAQRPGVETTDSGLQFQILEAPTDSESPRPAMTDTVKVHYHGTLVNGTVFDSSIDRGEPITFPLRSVIPGWVEALQLMQVGEKRRLYIPPALGYGSKGAGSVPPNAVLLFDLELLGIE